MKRVKERYLIAYNVIQASAWTIVARAIVKASYGTTNETPYDAARDVLVTFQMISLLEVAHAIVGITKTPIGSALMQWLGRTHVLMCALDPIKALHATSAATTLAAAWACTEVVRYPSYAMALYSKCPAWLNWLRYTIFIPLYPIGAGAEMKLMYDARAYAREKRMYSISMPNAMNFAFDYATFLNGLLIVYPFLFYSLYAYMFAQRKNKLGHVSSVGKTHTN